MRNILILCITPIDGFCLALIICTTLVACCILICLTFLFVKIQQNKTKKEEKFLDYKTQLLISKNIEETDKDFFFYYSDGTLKKCCKNIIYRKIKKIEKQLKKDKPSDYKDILKQLETITDILNKYRGLIK
ncbi:MAG: hypothetical protein H6687_01240 [Bacillales bacterium]|nr:hypothetical protein [Bacillales bacterium]